jgi:5'-nucleotidase
MEELIFPNPDNFQRQKMRLVRGGASKLKVLADFDRTLTTNFIHGRKAPSLIGALREGSYLSDDYALKAQALFDYYHPFEEDLTLSLENKKDLMTEWWQKHFKLLIDAGLTEEKIADVADNRLPNLRQGAVQFLELMAKENIPIYIFSASGLGVSGLKYYLTRRGLWTDNIILVANDFVWDKGGHAIDFKEPVIHSFNKDETGMVNISEDKKFVHRSNILLLGDSLGDIGMDNGFDAQAVLKIGFLNDKIQEYLPHYREVYDALILNDGDFNLPFEIIKEIINY